MISKEEGKQGFNGGRLFERQLEIGDTDKDGQLSLAELKKMPQQPMQRGRGSAEYHMPDLQHPQAEGKKLDPTFFLGNLTPGPGLSDLDRRRSLARYITSPDNPWFAKAFAGPAIWGQLASEGFYMPIDDIGPERTANYPAALEALAAGFTASGYDVPWLFRAIANTETYQRQIRPRDPAAPAPAFASATPVRLRADQLYSAIARVLGFKEDGGGQRQQPMGGPYQPDRTLRGQFHVKFGFDPSTTPDELMGTIPQALYMMNSGLINNLIRAEADSPQPDPRKI